MSTERRILIAVGSLIIAGVIAVACFSLGVYVGKQGWATERPLLAGPQPGPGDQPGQGQQPPGQGQQPFAPPGNRPGPDQPGAGGQQPNAPQGAQRQPSVVGVVRRVDEGNVTVEAREGTRRVTLTERTRFARRAQTGKLTAATVEDVQPGTEVAVLGPRSQDGRTLIADAVILLSQR